MAATQRALLDDLNELALINETMKPVEARKRILTDRIKQGMGLAGLDELADGETGVSARIQDRQASPKYDLGTLSLTKEGEAAIVSAAFAGALKPDHTIIERIHGYGTQKWAEQLWQVQMPGGIASTALIVTKGEH